MVNEKDVYNEGDDGAPASVMPSAEQILRRAQIHFKPQPAWAKKAARPAELKGLTLGERYWRIRGNDKRSGNIWADFPDSDQAWEMAEHAVEEGMARQVTIYQVTGDYEKPRARCRMAKRAHFSWGRFEFSWTYEVAWAEIM